MDSDGSSPPAESSSILTKAFQLLNAFNSQDRVLSLSELTRSSGLPKSTVHRLLSRLIELEVLERHPSGYKLGIRLTQLGASTPAAKMRDVALPHMVTLRQWSGRTVSLSVLRGLEEVCLEQVGPQVGGARGGSVGQRLPAPTTAAGRILLAYENLGDLAEALQSPAAPSWTRSIGGVPKFIAELRSCRENGLARQNGPVTALAAPLLVSGFAIGAVSVAWAPRATDSASVEGRVEVALRDVASKVTAELKPYSVDHARWFPRSNTDPPDWKKGLAG